MVVVVVVIKYGHGPSTNRGRHPHTYGGATTGGSGHRRQNQKQEPHGVLCGFEGGKGQLIEREVCTAPCARRRRPEV